MAGALAKNILPKLYSVSKGVGGAFGKTARFGGKLGAVAVGAGLLLGNRKDSSGSGSSGSFGPGGLAGSAARSGMAGGGSLPSVRPASKPSVSASMGMERLLIVSIGYLASIDQTLKNKLELSRSSYTQSLLAKREAGAEKKSGSTAFQNMANSKFGKALKEGLLSTALAGAGLASGFLTDKTTDPNNPNRTMGEKRTGNLLLGIAGAFAGVGAFKIGRALFAKRAAKIAEIAETARKARVAKISAGREAASRGKVAAQYMNKTDTRRLAQQLKPQLEARGFKYNRANNAWYDRNGKRLTARQLAQKVATLNELNILNKAGPAVNTAGAAAKTLGIKGMLAGGAKHTGRMLLAKVPVLGFIINTGIAAMYANNGEYGKASLAFLSGIASTFPGVGTGVSFALDAALIGIEGYEMLNPDKESGDVFQRMNIGGGAPLPAGNQNINPLSMPINRRSAAARGTNFSNVPFERGAGSIKQAEGTSRAANPYDVVFGYGQYVSPPKPLTQMTIGEVQDFQTKLINATKGQGIRGLGPNEGTGAVGAYQFNKGTLRDQAQAVYGDNWRSQIFNAQTQDRLAKNLYETVRNDPARLAPTWAYFRNVSSTGRQLQAQAGDIPDYTKNPQISSASTPNLVPPEVRENIVNGATDQQFAYLGPEINSEYSPSGNLGRIPSPVVIDSPAIKQTYLTQAYA